MATQQQGAFAYIISVDVGWPDMTWVEARNKCNEHGLSFAKVLSEDDQTKMRYKLLGFKKGVDDGIYTPSPDANCKGGDPTEWPCGLWIGGNDREVEGMWKWTNGLLMSYYNFGGFDPSTGQVPGLYPWGSEASGATADEPNNWNKTAGFELGEDCARLDLEYSTGLWNDVPCDWKSPFVCELVSRALFRFGTAQPPPRGGIHCAARTSSPSHQSATTVATRVWTDSGGCGGHLSKMDLGWCGRDTSSGPPQASKP